MNGRKFELSTKIHLLNQVYVSILLLYQILLTICDINSNNSLLLDISISRNLLQTAIVYLAHCEIISISKDLSINISYYLIVNIVYINN